MRRLTLLLPAFLLAVALPGVARGDAPRHIPTYRVAELLGSRLEGLGLQWRSKGENAQGEREAGWLWDWRRRKGSTSVSGSLTFGDRHEWEIPRWRARKRKWERSGTAKVTRSPALVEVRIEEAGGSARPVDVAAGARPPRRGDYLHYALGEGTKIKRIVTKGTEETVYTRNEASDFLVERLMQSRDTPWRLPVARYGKKSISKPEPAFDPVKASVFIAYRYEDTGGNTQQIRVKIHVRNSASGINVVQRMDPGVLEAAAIAAIREAAREMAPRKRTPQPAAPPPTIETPPEPDTPATPPPVEPEPTVQEPEPEPTPALPPVRPTTDLPADGPHTRVVGLLSGLGDVQKELALLKAQLRATMQAIEEEEQLLADARRTVELLGANDPKAAWYANWVSEMETRLVELREERQQLLQKAVRAWDGLASKLDDLLASDLEDKELERDMQGFRSHLRTRKELSMIEVFLAAGEHDAVLARLRPLLEMPETSQHARELHVTALIDLGKPEAALEAAREGLRRHPKSPTLEQYVLGLEVAFLRAISARAVGDGATLHAAWAQHMEGSDWTPLAQIAFRGLRQTWQTVTGRAARLEAIHASGVERAAAEHNGLELMVRLRRLGLTLEQIRNLSVGALRSRLRELRPNARVPSDDVIEQFHISLEVALESEGFRRLSDPDRAFSGVDGGANPYGAEEFKQSWAEWGLEFVSIKNVVMLAGPLARVGGPSTLARYARWVSGAGSAGSTAAKQAAAAEASALTLQEWVHARPFFQAAARRIANSRGGAVLKEARHALRSLRYDGRFPTRVATGAGMFAGDMAATWLVMEGLGEVGQRMGGDLGRVAGETAALMIGAPITSGTANLQQRWEASMAAAQRARKRWKQAETVLRQLRAPVREAARTLVAGQQLESATRETLETVVVRAEAAAQAARTAARAEGGTLLTQVADEAEALAASAKASLAGQGTRASAGAEAAAVIEREAAEGAVALQTATQRLEQGTATAAGRGTVVPAGRTVVPRAPGATAVLDDAARAMPQTHVNPLQAAAGGASRTASTAVEATGSIAALERRALKAMQAEKFDDAAALFHTASRHPEAAEAVALRLAERAAEARGAAKSLKLLATRGRRAAAQGAAEAADAALEPFTAEQRRHLAKQTMESTVSLSEQGVGGARLIKDSLGGPMAVWKPAKSANDLVLKGESQLVAELLASRLAREAGLRVPHVEAMMLEGQAGIVVRWIPKTRELGQLSAGARAALKRQAAGFRPLQVLLGNFDVHLGNFKVDELGRVWAIDAGEAYITTPTMTVNDVMSLLRNLRGRGVRNKSALQDWTRIARDMYDDMGSAGVDNKVAVHHLERLFTGKDMARSARALQEMTDQRLAELVREVMGHTRANRGRAKEVFATLSERRRDLATLLGERWP